MTAMASLYELIEHQPGGTLAEDSEPIEYAAYEEIIVTRAAYEQLIEENARLRGELADLHAINNHVERGAGDVAAENHTLKQAMETAVYHIVNQEYKSAVSILMEATND